MSLLVLAKRMGVSINEMAMLDVATVLDMAEQWFGGKRSAKGAVKTVRQATQTDVNRMFG